MQGVIPSSPGGMAAAISRLVYLAVVRLAAFVMSCFGAMFANAAALLLRVFSTMPKDSRNPKS